MNWDAIAAIAEILGALGVARIDTRLAELDRMDAADIRQRFSMYQSKLNPVPETRNGPVIDG